MSSERRSSCRLLSEYASYVSGLMEAGEAASLLNEKAEIELKNRNFPRAKLLYDAYMNIVIRNYPEEDASLLISELADI